MTADWEPGGLLLEAWSHLRCAAVVLQPSESLAMDHARQAYALLDAARMKAIEEESMWKGAHTWSCERTDEDPRGDPPKPERDDCPDDDTPRPGEVVRVGRVNGDYLRIATENARAQAKGIADMVTAERITK